MPLLDRLEGALHRGDPAAVIEVLVAARQSLEEKVARCAARAGALVERFPDLESMRASLESWEQHARATIERLSPDAPAAALALARGLAEMLDPFESSLASAERHAAGLYSEEG